MPSDTGDHKLVLVVRNDLKMGKGKVAAQCAHAAVAAVENSVINSPDRLTQWKNTGQPKVVVKVDNEQLMRELQLLAQRAGLTTSVIRDAGRTQIPSGTATVLAIGPATLTTYSRGCAGAWVGAMTEQNLRASSGRFMVSTIQTMQRFRSMGAKFNHTGGVKLLCMQACQWAIQSSRSSHIKTQAPLTAAPYRRLDVLTKQCDPVII